MQKLTRGEIAALSAIIGKCAIKSVGSDLFFPMIKLKAAATANALESQELLKKIYEELGLTEETSKLIGDALGKDIAASERKLNNDVVEFHDTKLLSTDQFLLFSNENPTLTANELEFLYKWMVKED